MKVEESFHSSSYSDHNSW